jgi:hypothetical protein
MAAPSLVDSLEYVRASSLLEKTKLSRSPIVRTVQFQSARSALSLTVQSDEASAAAAVAMVSSSRAAVGASSRLMDSPATAADAVAAA